MERSWQHGNCIMYLRMVEYSGEFLKVKTDKKVVRMRMEVKEEKGRLEKKRGKRVCARECVF